MFCSNCGKEIDDKATVCVGCGVFVKDKQKTKTENNQSSTVKILSLLFPLLSIVLAVLAIAIPMTLIYVDNGSIGGWEGKLVGWILAGFSILLSGISIVFSFTQKQEDKFRAFLCGALSFCALTFMVFFSIFFL